MNCEETQIEISSWLDGEIAPWDALPLADHLLGCPACAGFFRRARSLEKAFVMAPPLPVAAPVRRRAASRVAPWVLPLAATVLLAFGGFALGRQAWRELASGPAQAVTRQAGAPMTDARFVGITRELLESPPRYRTEMLRVMAEVAESRPLEGSVDSRAPQGRTGDGEGGERAAAVQGN